MGCIDADLSQSALGRRGFSFQDFFWSLSCQNLDGYQQGVLRPGHARKEQGLATMSPNDDPLIPDVQKYLAQRISEAAPDSMLAVSWEHFFYVYDRVIRAVVVKYLGQDEHVDDCVQQVWLFVVQELVQGGFRSDGKGMRVWLFRVARSLTVNVVRQRKRSIEPLPDDAAERLPSPGLDNPADADEQLWNQQLVHAALAVLAQRSPPESYEIFFLRRIEERPVSELAKRFNLPKRSIRERTERIERRFVALLKLYAGKVLG